MVNSMLQGSLCTGLCGSCVWAGREASAGWHICEGSGGGRREWGWQHIWHDWASDPPSTPPAFGTICCPPKPGHAPGWNVLGPAGLASCHLSLAQVNHGDSSWTHLLTPQQGHKRAARVPPSATISCSLPLLPEGLRCQQSCGISGERSPRGSCSPVLSFSYSVTVHKPTLFSGECLSSRRHSLLRVGRSPIKHTRKILFSMSCVSGAAGAPFRCHGGVGDPASVASFQNHLSMGWDCNLAGWSYLQKPYKQHTCVVCPLHQQQKENVACFLLHFPWCPLCYSVLFPHSSNLSNFPFHVEVKSF